MRRFSVIVAFALLAVPAAAHALGSGPGDGTLAISNATGSVSIAARGALIGRVDQGRVIIDDPNPNDGAAPVVWGYESKKDLTDTKARYAGTDIRFRMIGGTFKIKVIASGVNLAVVGRGTVILNGAGSDDNGSYSVNGAPYADVPDFSTFALNASSP